jgi:protein-disulfide isomerase
MPREFPHGTTISPTRLTAGLLGVTLASGALAQMSVPPTPIASNPADAPTRTQSGRVFASTDANLPPAIGPAPAKVLVVVYSDFQCPVCRRSADATRQIAEEFPEEVRVAFWQHALPMHSNAENAAVASLAAQRQGRFWDYHDELFRNQSALDTSSLIHYADSLGLDVEQFKRDLEDPALRTRVKRESAIADTLGATGTPAFSINGKLNVGWGSWASFRGNVERELNEARRAEAGGTPLAQLGDVRARALVTDEAKLQTYLTDVLLTAMPAKVVDQAAQADPTTKKKDKRRKKRKAEAEIPAGSAAPSN